MSSISPELRSKIQQCKTLLVGAGGIGCEVLKNLTLTGFRNIDVIDLDTIDVSNLNRQFLFNKSHVGRSKAEVAIDVASSQYALEPDQINARAIHKSIMSSEFDVDFFRQYTFVINALDNRAARSHVNRMCLAAEIPLLESGTAGYVGQSKLIKNGLTACYECDGIQKEGRTYATCTIRNTPSEPIHCIVWAKHLFHQLFGEEDPDNDVSPQMDDEQSTGDMNSLNGHNGLSNPAPEPSSTELNGSVNGNDPNSKTEVNLPNGLTASSNPISTREWANKNGYDPVLLIDKLYNKDVHYLLSMENLWKERTRPVPLDYANLTIETADEPHCSKSLDDNYVKLNDQRLWALKECVEVFSESVSKLHQKMEIEGFQTWDKDDEDALKFVVAASNLRSECFHIERKSLFDVKSLAGNIVPAISSTNSIIGGVLILQALRILKSIPLGDEYRKMEDSDRNELLKNTGRLTFLNYTSLTKPDLIASYECPPPVPECLACAKGNMREVEVRVPFGTTTLGDLVDKIVIGTYHFVCPDLALNDDSGTIIFSKDEDDEPDNDSNKKKKLSELAHIKSPKTRLLVTDLVQDKGVILVLINELVK